MKRYNIAARLIATLKRGNFYAECPCCGETIKLGTAGLFYLNKFPPDSERLYEQKLIELKEKADALKSLRKSISEKSEIGARAVNIGFILERLAPSLETFRFNRNDCRSLFDPIDYIIFEGLSSKGKVTKIFFTDIKTGEARLRSSQKEIKNLIIKKRVSWDIYKRVRESYEF